VIELEGFGAAIFVLVLLLAALRLRDGRRSLDAVRSSDFWKWKDDRGFWKGKADNAVDQNTARPETERGEKDR
jgi:hypothetical protein